MFLHQFLYESHGDELDAKTIQTLIASIEETLEEINSKSIWISETKPNSKQEKQLERKYAAYDVIKTILMNDLRRKNNPSLRHGSIIMYSFEDDSLPVAAVQAHVSGKDVEIKWVGSVVPGHGKQLLDAALREAKRQGAVRANLLAKYGSEPFYSKHGYTQTTRQGADPLSGTGERFERNI